MNVELSMGTMSSCTVGPTVTEESESPYIYAQSTGVKNSKVHDMALAYGAQTHHPDDLNHDTLMGLQELEAIFEKTAKDPSSSDSLSDVLSDDFNSIEVIPITHFNEQKDVGSYPKNSTPTYSKSSKRGAPKYNGISKYAIPRNRDNEK
jgi:hypothetical protein